MTPNAKFTYTGVGYGKRRKPDVIAEVVDASSIGIHVPLDGAEFNYFSPKEVQLIAYGLLALLEGLDIAP